MKSATAESTSSSAQKFQRARQAAARLAQLSTSTKNSILLAMAAQLAANQEKILRANRADLEAAPELSGSLRDRLLLNPQRIAEIVKGMEAIVRLDDPVGQVIEESVRPNGLRIRKVRVPLGVVGLIYESRPNVTVDAAALCFKTGNAIVLRGGKEASRSNEALVEILNSVEGVPVGAVELLDSSSRESVEQLLGARGYVDVLVPRGGAALIDRVVRDATIPVIETGAGNCHVFVDDSADLEMADRIVLNAKIQRPSVCNAAEKLLVHEHLAAAYVPRIVRKLQEKGVEVRGDEKTVQLAHGQGVIPATSEDWPTEYLDLRIAVRVVRDVEEAIAHINGYSTHHSDAIVTADEARAGKFLREVDSAVVYWNASTRFTDGGEFGLGAEMGISTQKLHCRGPFGLAELTSMKYEILGSGQVRA